MTQTPLSAVAATSQQKKPATQLIRLSPEVWLQEAATPAPAARKDGDSNDPDLILLFGWMNGRLSHVQKYTDKYRELYPTSELLLITSQSNIFWNSKERNTQLLLPAVKQLEARGIALPAGPDGSKRKPKLLVHVFSNGGCMQLLHLVKVLQQHRQRQTQRQSALPPRPLPATALVIDSAPGGNALSGLLKAFTVGIKNPLLLYSTYVFISTLWFLGALYDTILRPKPWGLNKMRLELLQPTLFDPSAPRLFVYSESDSIISASDVEEHLAKARQAGLSVEACKFDNSAHISHGRTDPVRYWKTITEFWSRSVSQ